MSERKVFSKEERAEMIKFIKENLSTITNKMIIQKFGVSKTTGYTLVNEAKAELQAAKELAAEAPFSGESDSVEEEFDPVGETAGAAAAKKTVTEISKEVKQRVLDEYSHVLDVGEFVAELFTEEAIAEGMELKEYIGLCVEFYLQNKGRVAQLEKMVQDRETLIMVAYDDLNSRTREENLLMMALDRLVKWKITGAPVSPDDINAVVAAVIFGGE